MFPFDQPGSTAFYLVLYLGTLVLHVVPMNYVLAGSSYLALLGVWEAARGGVSDAHQRIAAGLRDWMPFALSVAITAGVAPLLFLQVLYKQPFYTANLLLLHRWMAILPVLIVAFYLLYLQKSKRFQARPAVVRMLVSVGIFLCFGFVAWSWTENHVLSTRGQEVWIEQYARGGWFYGDRELPARMALWWVGAFPMLSMILAWQVPSARAALARVALPSLVAAAAAGVVYYFQLPADARQSVVSVGWPWLTLGLIGWVAQAALWTMVWRGRQLRAELWLGLSAAAVLTAAGVTVLRELRRLSAVDITEYYEAHAAAARVGGWWLFAALLAMNAGLVVWVVRIACRPPVDADSPGA